MGRPLRSEQYSPDEVAILHCVQRCVRRGFLTGVDPVSGQDYGYRREWIRRRMEALASVFGCDILGYAIMSNHMHLILRTRPDVVAAWSDEEVAIRWLRVFPGRRLEEHLGDPTDGDVESLVRDRERLAVVRGRLSDISWFMRALSEPIARMANRQDEVTGRFWEGRFKAQRITDEAGLLACAMYVDLNPIRAALAESLEAAEHTSAYDRLQSERGKKINAAAFDLKPIPTEKAGEILKTSTPDKLRRRKAAKRRNPTGRKIRRDGWLAPLTLGKRSSGDDVEVSRTGVRASDKGFLDLDWHEYLDLLRWTARQQGPEAGKQVPPRMRATLGKLGVELGMWRDLVWNFKRYFGRSSCAGSPQSMSSHAQAHDRKWARGQAAIRKCFTA